MDFIYEKIAYLRGFCEGAGFGEDTKEGKVFSGILDILDEMAVVLETVYEDDEDLSDEEDDEDEAEAEYNYAFICPNCGEEIEVSEEAFEDNQMILCPKCGTDIPVATDADDLKF